MKQNLKGLSVLMLVLILPAVSHAGILTLVGDLFKGEVSAQTVEVTEANSQNMPLLHAAINSNPALIKGGSDIEVVNGSSLLAEAGPSGTIADIEEVQNNGQISTYIVQKGDSLSRIAALFNISVNTILWANDIKGGVIKEGQTLVILPISGIQHKVKSGETLKGIVAKYKADIDEVMSYNNLTPDSVLAVDDIITIPDAELAPIVTTPSKSSSKKSSEPVLTAKLHDANGPNYVGYYTRPIVGGVRTQGLHGYNAVDLASPIGTPIYAAAAGTVIISSYGDWNHGYGNYIVISHPNGTQTLYAHASKLIATQGEHVNQGQMIALVGSTGKSTGPHVHFEVRGAKNPF